MKNFKFKTLILLVCCYFLTQAWAKEPCDTYKDEIKSLQDQQSTMKAQADKNPQIIELRKQRDKLLPHYKILAGLQSQKDRYQVFRYNAAANPNDTTPVETKMLVKDGMKHITQILATNALINYLIDQNQVVEKTAPDNFIDHLSTMCKIKENNKKKICSEFHFIETNKDTAFMVNFFTTFKKGTAHLDVKQRKKLLENYQTNLLANLNLTQPADKQSTHAQTIAYLEKQREVLLGKSGTGELDRKAIALAIQRAKADRTKFIEAKYGGSKYLSAFEKNKNSLEDGRRLISSYNQARAAEEQNRGLKLLKVPEQSGDGLTDFFKAATSILDLVKQDPNFNCPPPKKLAACLSELPMDESDLKKKIDKVGEQLKDLQNQIAQLSKIKEYMQLNNLKHMLYSSFTKANCTELTLHPCPTAGGEGATNNVNPMEDTTTSYLTDDASAIVAHINPQAMKQHQQANSLKEACKKPSIQQRIPKSCSTTATPTVNAPFVPLQQQTQDEVDEQMIAKRIQAYFQQSQDEIAQDRQAISEQGAEDEELERQRYEELKELQKTYPGARMTKGGFKLGKEKRSYSSMFGEAFLKSTTDIPIWVNTYYSHKMALPGLYNQAMFMKYNQAYASAQSQFFLNGWASHPEFWSTNQSINHPAGFNPLTPFR
ncbi:MAG: hypothetical protein ISR65_02785 [Bacteriovoracaceae bacterium]|nr:hypothetical protein [Bacteriovoracaceae bacterium]